MRINGHVTTRKNLQCSSSSVMSFLFFLQAPCQGSRLPRLQTGIAFASYTVSCNDPHKHWVGPVCIIIFQRHLWILEHKTVSCISPVPWRTKPKTTDTTGAQINLGPTVSQLPSLNTQKPVKMIQEQALSQDWSVTIWQLQLTRSESVLTAWGCFTEQALRISCQR